MTLTFFTNYINHHQVPLADEMYEILGDGYRYVAMEPLPQSFKDSGYPDFSDRPYLIKAYENTDNLQDIEKLALDSDVVIIGSAPGYLVRERLAHNKLTFQYSERWFRQLNYKLLSPRLWKYLYQTHIKYRNKRFYLLAASAFAPNDARRIFAYPDKCYKWGYFPKTEALDIENILMKKRTGSTSILWCARFLKLKHPELAVKLARNLKADGYDFHIDMIGTGEEFGSALRLARELGVSEYISFLGNRPNDEVLKQMQTHHIFIFTSDRNEGWGAVLNEAMSNGCAVVASNKIGAVPFLIDNKVNGAIFRSEDVGSLTNEVAALIKNRSLCEQYARSAYHTIENVWSAPNAAQNLMQLIASLENGQTNPVGSGPCSKAAFVDSNKIMRK